MTWPPPNRYARDVSEIGDLRPVEVLYEFDGPCIFTATAPNGGALLAYLVEELEDEHRLRYLVSTTTDTIVQSLKQGTVSVRDALVAGWIWICDLSFDWKVERLFSIPRAELPEDALPAAGTMLWPELDPALRVRLVGESVQEGSIPALVLGQVGEIAKSLKVVFEYAARDVLGEPSGRPPEWLRTLYNLPAQRLAYGSLEVSFKQLLPSTQLDIPGTVSPTLATAVADEGWRLLTRGLEWISSNDEDLDADSSSERKAILEALRRLSPSATGPVTTVEISGARVGGHTKIHELTRSSSKRIRQKLAALHSAVRIEAFFGRVRELDLDKMEFILRDISGAPNTEILCTTDDEQHIEVAREAHYQECPVTLAVKRSAGSRWHVVDIELAAE